MPAVHPVGHDGAVGGPPIEWLETAIGAHAIQTDPSNTFAFVPHIDNRGGPNAIFQFKFDPNTGHLTPNSPPRVGQPTGTGPRHFCFHPSKDMLYFSNEQGSSVTAYNFDPTNGTLSAFQTISTLPTGYEQKQHLLPNSDVSLREIFVRSQSRPQQHRGLLSRRVLRSVDGHRARRNRRAAQRLQPRP